MQTEDDMIMHNAMQDLIFIMTQENISSLLQIIAVEMTKKAVKLEFWNWIGSRLH